MKNLDQSMKLLTLGFVVASLASMATSAVSEEIGVGCSLIVNGDVPSVQFSGVQSEVDTKNFAESGQISVTVKITALDGSIFVASRSVSYNRVGNRLELPYVSSFEALTLPVTLEQFQTEFGFFPTVICVTP